MPTVFDAPPRPQNFYPRLTWSTASVLDFTMPLSALQIREIPVRGQNIALSGLMETLLFRTDYVVALVWQYMPPQQVTPLRNFVNTWGLLGKQAVLLLDRYYTCGGQHEFDTYQSTFSRAELLNNPFSPQRVIPARGGLFTIELVFRQGSAGGG
jgi:hypothetical protein